MIGLRQWLAHPLTRGLDIDDPATTHLRRRIVREKGFLRYIYQEWHGTIATALPAGQGPVLELGSGAGFLGDFVPDLITSEIFPCADVRVILDGMALPFSEASLRGLVMTDVLHHVPAARRLFAEAARCVRPGGVLVCIEPWVTLWSRLVYTHLHHEPFCPDAAAWEFPPRGPLSGANGALPWIIFERDRAQFEREFPEWHIQEIDRMMPFRYLVSGGVSLRSLMPGCTFSMWWGFEKLLQPWMDRIAMFARIVLRRTV
jgi:SAM-dependent methyltransferase